MDVAQIIRLVRKWGWLMLIGAIILGGITFIIRSGQPAVYQAETKIAIGGFIQSPNPNTSEIYTGLQLAETYAELVTTSEVLEGALRTLDLDTSLDLLRERIGVRTIQNTSLLVITVKDTNPTQAADLANAVANQLILNSPTNLTPEQQQQIDIANDQIARLRDQLESAGLQQQLLDQRRAATSDADELAQIDSQYTALTEQINLASATIAQFNSTISSLQQRTNSLDIVEPANIPTEPLGSSIVIATFLSILAGAGLGFGFAMLIEYLDDTLRSTEQVAQVLGLPVLGAIARFGKPSDNYASRLISHLPLMLSQAAEGYRTVRTNLMFSAQNERHKVYLITSAGPQEGKSLTSANLAISMALAGQRVLLIDCDLRRPRLHEIFGLKNEIGLTTLLLSSHQNGSSAHGAQLSQCVQKTHVDKLYAITSGFIPQNPNEILGSALMQHWMRTLQESPDFDVILLDTPPALLLSDSVVLSASTNAEVVLIVEAGRTRRAAAQRVKEMFAHTGCHITGAILNGVSLRDESYYYGYGYDSYYYRSNANGNNGTERSNSTKHAQPTETPNP
ncbi:MAG: polysaccharide biosynthesis tyrosine autokinase [Anaerolineae bacterium]|nr:polysaccharide biosynthesis tyrosine autokinase [Anaerolineae bacterium]